VLKYPVCSVVPTGLDGCRVAVPALKRRAIVILSLRDAVARDVSQI
jgi:hypothetical protein